MIRSKDLIGMRFGLLTVVSMGEKRKTPNGTIDFRKRKDDCDGINTPSETYQHTVDV